MRLLYYFWLTAGINAIQLLNRNMNITLMCMSLNKNKSHTSSFILVTHSKIKQILKLQLSYQLMGVH